MLCTVELNDSRVVIEEPLLISLTSYPERFPFDNTIEPTDDLESLFNSLDPWKLKFQSWRRYALSRYWDESLNESIKYWRSKLNQQNYFIPVPVLQEVSFFLKLPTHKKPVWRTTKKNLNKLTIKELALSTIPNSTRKRKDFNLDIRRTEFLYHINGEHFSVLYIHDYQTARYDINHNLVYVKNFIQKRAWGIRPEVAIKDMFGGRCFKNVHYPKLSEYIDKKTKDLFCDNFTKITLLINYYAMKNNQEI